MWMGCATPRTYDLDKSAAGLPPGKGLLVGKVQRVNGNLEAEKWRPTVMAIAGVQFRIETVVNGENNNYGVTNDGYYAILADAGELKDAKITVEYKGQGQAVTVTSGFAIDLATPAKPVKVEAGKVRILPTRFVVMESTLRTDFKEIKIETDAKTEPEVMAWFKEGFPSPGGASFTR